MNLSRFRRRRHRWNHELLVCGFRGHVTPAHGVATLREEDAGLGVQIDDGRRFVRCLRCDDWVETVPPASPTEALRETLPPREEIEFPRRGQELREAIILRLIAVDRGVHAVIFGLVAFAVIYLETHLAAARSAAARLLRGLTGAASNTGQGNSQSFIARELARVQGLHQHTLVILAFTAVAYAVVEGTEAVGLWLERRWAEYLTALATAGFLPFEIKELADRVTVLRIVALVLNVAILIYLVWAKRLFGAGGGPKTREEIDREALLGPPSALSR
jgi:uncharacterized membrane protein (DUF2068 family)